MGGSHREVRDFGQAPIPRRDTFHRGRIVSCPRLGVYLGLVSLVRFRVASSLDRALCSAIDPVLEDQLLPAKACVLAFHTIETGIFPKLEVRPLSPMGSPTASAFSRCRQALCVVLLTVYGSRFRPYYLLCFRLVCLWVASCLDLVSPHVPCASTVMPSARQPAGSRVFSTLGLGGRGFKRHAGSSRGRTEGFRSSQTCDSVAVCVGPVSGFTHPTPRSRASQNAS
ncbi:hypothetical protein BD414DRAFT_126337 [Trametes punicea]|nr:hypothetical protein BD414DRAFT_126337 [Trametes punicea]